MATSKQLAPAAPVMALVDRHQTQIEVALPAGMDMSRMARMLRTQLSSNELLAKCEPLSVLGSFIECMQLGLEPGITAHFVPFYSSKDKGYTCTLIADYRGLMQLAMRSGHVSNIYADLIRQGDTFTIQRGSDARLEHSPMIGNMGEVIASYAVAHMANGTSQFEVLARHELDDLQESALSKIKNDAARKYSPWAATPRTIGEMYKKSAIRRLCKFLPFATQDAKLTHAVVLDEAQERGDQRLTFEMNEAPESAAAALEDKVRGNTKPAPEAASEG